MSKISDLSPLLTPFRLITSVFSDRYEADRTYDELRPILDDLFMQGRGYQDPSVQHIVNILRELPNGMAKKRNFEQRYLIDEYTLRQLPKKAIKFRGRGIWY